MAAERWFAGTTVEPGGLTAAAAPSRVSLQAEVTSLVRDLRDGWTGRCIALSVAYVVAAYATSTALLLPMNWLVPYMLSQARGVLVAAYVLLLLGWIGDRVLGPRARLAGATRRLTSFRFLGEIVLATVAVHVTLIAFVNLKLWIPVIDERLYDSPLWRLDAWLHGGVPIAPLVMELAARHGLLPILDRAYLLFFPAQVAVPLLFLLSDRLHPQRGRFFFAYCLLWAVGSGLYLLWPSLGPIYYMNGRFPWIGEAPYANGLQQVLIDDYTLFRALPFNHQVKLYYGVAALPSLHVAVLALFAIAVRRVRWLATVLWTLTAVTFVGSLALGWHYAVDGYLGLALAWGCWWVARFAVVEEALPSAVVQAAPAATTWRDWLFDSAERRRAAVEIATAGLVPLFAIGAFCATVFHQFAYDDVVHVLGDPRTHLLSNIGRFFTSPTWPGNLYRPIPGVTYALTYAFAGHAPWAYHATNVLLHAAVGVLALFCLRPLVGRDAALLASLLFAVHPVHAEAVANVSGRTEVLAALFTLSALVAIQQAERARSFRRAAWLGGAGVAFLLALLSKESAACLLLLVPLCLWMLPRREGASLAPEGEAAADERSPMAVLRALVRMSALPLVALGSALAIFLWLRWSILGYLATGPERVVTPIDNPLVALPAAERIGYALLLLGRYVWLIFVPAALSPDYSFGAPGVPPDNLGLGDALLGGACLALLLAAIALGLRRDRRVAFFGLWFLAAFAVTSNVVGAFGPAFAERVAYLPSLGICGLAALGLLSVSQKRLRLGLAAAAVALLSLRTIAYARIWYDNGSLFGYAAAVAPGSPRAQSGFAEALAKKGEFTEARRHFDEALRLNPDYVHAYVGLAVAELLQGHAEEAAARFEKFLERQPEHIPTLIMLGDLRLRQGRPDDAGRLYVRVLNIDDTNFDARLGVLRACLARGNLAQATALRDELMAIAPDHPALVAASAEIDARQAASEPRASGDRSPPVASLEGPG